MAAGTGSPATTRSSSGVLPSVDAATGSPPTIMSSAGSAPTSRGRRCVPPAPGMRPSLTSGRPSLASAAATRWWAASASSSPPPRQDPVMAAITGLGPASICAMSWGRAGAAELAGVPNSRMSAPPDQRPPAPVSTIARTVASACARSSAAAIPARAAWDKPLTGGLANVMMAVARSILVRTSATGRRSELAPIDLAEVRGGQRIDEDHLARTLVRLQPVAHEGFELLHQSVPALPGHDVGVRFDQAVGVGHAHHRHLRHGGVEQQAALHLRRREPLA